MASFSLEGGGEIAVWWFECKCGALNAVWWLDSTWFDEIRAVGYEKYPAIEIMRRVTC
jgi:hypothetical protein